MQTIRRNALEKLAALSVRAPPSPSVHSDLSRLCKKCPSLPPAVNGFGDGTGSGHTATSSVPMVSQRPLQAPFDIARLQSTNVLQSLPELETLLALSKAAPLVSSTEAATQLLHQLSPYLPESHAQAIAPSPALRELTPSPWELLTFDLAYGVLSLGLNHPSLQSSAAEAIYGYIERWVDSARLAVAEEVDEEDGSEFVDDGPLSKVIILTLSLLGFLDAIAKRASFWSAHERLQLIRMLKDALSDRFMIFLESTLSIIRNARSSQRGLKGWKRYIKHYAANGRPLGAMLLRQEFTQTLVAFASLLVAEPESLSNQGILDFLLMNRQLDRFWDDATEDSMLEDLTDIAADEIKLLEEGSDYLQLGSAWQQRLASAVKANAFICLLCCTLLNDEIADIDVLITWLDATLSDPLQIADENLATVVLKNMAVLSKTSPDIASNMSRSLPRVIVQGGLESRAAAVAADCLALILKLLPQDVIVTTLYTLGNVLSASNAPDRAMNTSPLFDGSTMGTHRAGTTYTHHGTGSAISLAPSDQAEPSTVYATVIQTIVGIASSCKDEKITALALSMLVQKVGRISLTVDAKIITEVAILGVYSAPSDLRSLLKLYTRLAHDALVQNNTLVLGAIMDARMHLSRGIKRESPQYEVYLHHLLDTIVSQGDVTESESKHMPNADRAALEIAQLLSPAATFVAENISTYGEDREDESIISLQRDAWFNVVVHGFGPTSPLGQKYINELRLLAKYSRPLIAEERADMLESDIELNTVLRRGESPEHTIEQKRQLTELLRDCEPDIKTLSYPEVVFLKTTYLVETLRASSGDCTRVLSYFLDPRLKSGAMGNCMATIAMAAVSTYLSKTLSGRDQAFSTPYVAQQLAAIFTGCCHHVSSVQEVAFKCADSIITQVPSALYQKTSLFALLELLTIMWASCLEQETDEYEWKSRYTSPMGNVTVELGDDYNFRRLTLVTLHRYAKVWVKRVIDMAPLNIKGLLQTYLSEYDDEGAYGHVSLGRSFALEMGSMIPSTDQRLSAIESEPELNINTASDFIAQYTTRQEYRLVDGEHDLDNEWTRYDPQVDPLSRTRSGRETNLDDATTLLADMECRTLKHKQVSIAELRDVLRRAAALLCRTRTDQCAIAHHLVGIPFAVFTKQAIKLGISLWTGVINENPRMESRILVEIAANWEITVRKRLGLFNTKYKHSDPFYVKEEFAPSDKEAIMKRQQHAYNLIAPHFRLIQFLSSHSNATRLSSPLVQRIYHRLIHITLDAMGSTTSHPLAREVHMHVVLLGLRILTFSTGLDAAIQWRFRDRLLSAALAWFRLPPMWSFGGNRLQIKAETHLLWDIQFALQKLSPIGTDPTLALKPLHGKQDLLLTLLQNEQTRLMVWLFPLDYEKKHHFTSGQHGKVSTNAARSAALKTAWAEDPALAVQLATRFHQSYSLVSEVRWLVLNFPDRVLDEPDALEILLGSSLPDDVSFQLKYLLYWAPVNPITAVTYFLPAYGNHPFIIQYAMRALESHSVDVTFFYVPQIVQTLRYDVLGYVERYIIETGTFSQLFAHQIIWNMKANAYKDEDSQIPDPVKPTLDKVMGSLISSFTGGDRAFYEREFSFFNEITDISGKLRPYIKKSKPEKKQKIEEELRKIKLEVGVYLPSNPDGVVIGIDRKSGKPLQSHAKAPYMATFRIRKEKGDVMTIEDNIGHLTSEGEKPPDTYEVWQSAIFKVGDDCRQDVLALQMIAAFRGIFNSVGLDVYVYPYRVTATAPGCGVIDVLPNSISRDMLGREAVNGLYEYFVSKYGGEDSIRFQEARNNFVKSMAAYSLISYLLQFKDRHNGNIMIDDAGHILHIDFGFCFDIAPGGVRFERAPFKLTSEMIAVMGGSANSQPYRWFEELCIKGFLASRQHCQHLAHIVMVMLDSGLPCFKPETIQHFKDRFVLDKTERDAADFMKDLIKKSYNSYSTKGYDQFQLLTNGIPY